MRRKSALTVSRLKTLRKQQRHKPLLLDNSGNGKSKKPRKPSAAVQKKRSATSGGPYANRAVLSGRSFVDQGERSGVRLYYVVAAVNAAGSSPNSSEASALTK